MTTVTVPGSASGTPAISFTLDPGTGLQTAEDIANILAGAVTASTLTVTTVSGSGAIPAPGGSGVQELLITGPLTPTVPAGYNIVVNDAAAATTISAASNTAILSGNSGGLFAESGSATIVASGGSNVILQSGAGSVALMGGSGNDTIFAAGTGTIDGGGGNNFIVASGSDVLILSEGNDSIQATGAAATISIVGGGSDVVQTGAGQDTMFAGTGNATVFGSAGSDIDYVSGALGSATLVAGAGNETVNASGSAGQPLLMYAGSGSDVLIGGSGNDTVVNGSGSVTMFGGSGSNAFVFFKQSVGGATDIINNFTSADGVFFAGYAPESVSDLLSAATVGPAGVTLHLSDGTTVSFSNLTDASQLDGKINYSSACFVTGTLIRTQRGAVPVEALRKDDRVPVLIGGTTQPVVWLGYRHVDCRHHPNPTDVRPVRLSRGAFGPGRPSRDLLLSPDHALYVDGALIPIRYLVNGRTVRQEARDAVTYWHVELPAHNVLYADDMLAESYLDTGNRGAFANGASVVDLHPDFAQRVWETRACAPLVMHGRKLAAAKRRLHRRANALGHRVTGNPGLQVLVDDGEVFARANRGTLCVRLPDGTANVRLVSRVWTPAHMRPHADDTRSLGIAVSRLWVDGREIGLGDPCLAAGWHTREPLWRWTDGDALIVVPGAHELAFDIALTGTYWRAEAAFSAARAA